MGRTTCGHDSCAYRCLTHTFGCRNSTTSGHNPAVRRGGVSRALASKGRAGGSRPDPGPADVDDTSTGDVETRRSVSAQRAVNRLRTWGSALESTTTPRPASAGDRRPPLDQSFAFDLFVRVWVGWRRKIERARERKRRGMPRRLRPTKQAPRGIFGSRGEEVTVRDRFDGSELLEPACPTLMRPTSVGRRSELECACRRELRTSLGRACRSDSFGRLGAPRGNAARPRLQLDRTKGSRPRRTRSSCRPPSPERLTAPRTRGR
jgi:hypothetical protein